MNTTEIRDEVLIPVTSAAYVDGHINVAYEAYAETAGHRPVFGVLRIDGKMVVATNKANREHAERIVDAAEVAAL